jgi:hypothetical protein
MVRPPCFSCRVHHWDISLGRISYTISTYATGPSFTSLRDDCHRRDHRTWLVLPLALLGIWRLPKSVIKLRSRRITLCGCHTARYWAVDGSITATWLNLPTLWFRCVFLVCSKNRCSSQLFGKESVNCMCAKYTSVWIHTFHFAQPYSRPMPKQTQSSALNRQKSEAWLGSEQLPLQTGAK